jgi:hypothetical protein
MMMNSEAELSKEQQIMRAMRKTLTSIVRDVAPRDGVPSPSPPIPWKTSACAWD